MDKKKTKSVAKKSVKPRAKKAAAPALELRPKAPAVAGPARLPKIVCLGCGTGQATLLRGLKNQPCDLSAIVAVTDNGGHSGLLRKILNIPQVGDTRQCLAELGDRSHPLWRLLSYRFENRELEGVSLGNLMLAALTMSENSLSRAVNALRKTLNVRQRVFPVTDHNTHICAELDNGRVVVGEYEIATREPRLPIKRMFLKDRAAANSYALGDIETADLIVICPGTMMTGIVSILLTDGVVEAIKKSRAKKVMICNLMTQPGQTDGMHSSDHVNVLLPYLKTPLNYFLVNTGEIDHEMLKRYKKAGAEPVAVSRGSISCPGLKIVKCDFVEHPDSEGYASYSRAGKFPGQGLHFIRHDPRKIAEALLALVR